MIKVFFRDVGQGDAIFFEWENENGGKEIGILDCRKKNKINPILDEIISSGVKKISFLIISHFHEDHYSGLIEILEHCETHSVKIDHFLHTGQPVEFLSYIKTYSSEEIILLNATYEKIEYSIDKGIILEPSNLSDKIADIKLTKKMYLSFLSPNFRDYQYVMKQGKALIVNRQHNVD